MNKSTKRNLAVTAGLTAVLALSPVVGPLTTALADEATSVDSAVEQTADTETPASKSFCATDWNWFKGEWHLGKWWWTGTWHPKVDCNHNGFCDICGSRIDRPGCDRPGEGGEQDPVPVTYTVTFDDLVEDTTDQTVTVDAGTSVNEAGAEVATPTREGYSFLGWYTSKDYTTEFSFDAAINEDTTVYAKWAEDSTEDPVPVTYTVTFDDLVEDTEDQTVAVKAGTSVNEAGAEVATPTREGYSFLGWYTSKDYTTEFSFDAAINEDTTVYAKWAEDSTEEPGGETENPDTEKPGTDTENPGTDTENPGTDTENPGTDTEQPGTGTEQPGTDTEQPGTGTETPGSDDDADVVTPNDNADASDDAADDADKSNDASKKADETTNEDKSAAEDKSADEDALPSTGDASMAVSGIAALGTAVAGLGAFLRRRR